MPLDRDTVAIPFASGISPSLQARVLPAQNLLVAQNCQQLLIGAGPEKRNGHVGREVKTATASPPTAGVEFPLAAPNREPFSLGDPKLGPSWLFGYGVIDSTSPSDTSPLSVSPQPAVGQLFGVAQRDEEVVAWDGHRMLSAIANQGGFATTSNAVMPLLRAQQVSKVSNSQQIPEAADNGTVRVVTWKNSSTTVGYSAYDSQSQSAIVNAATLTFQSVVSARMLSCGGWFHIAVSDTVANSLELRSFHQSSPGSVVSRSFGAVDNQLDIKKIDETSFVLLKSKAGVLTAYVLNYDGTTLSTFVPDLGGHASLGNSAIACEINRSGEIGVAWQTGVLPTTAYFRVYASVGTAVTPVITVDTISFNSRMTLSPRYMLTTGSTQAWDVFVEELDIVTTRHNVRAYFVNGVTSALQAKRHNAVLGSHAFRVGNRNYVWLAPYRRNTVGLQSTWFICDGALLPVGKMDFGLASIDGTSTVNTLQSVNWSTPDAGHPYKDRIVFVGALPFNTRIATFLSAQNPGSTTPNGVFAEVSIHFYQLDFLPRLRSAPAGRSTYFAGAQVWAYDGTKLDEAQFSQAPEDIGYTVITPGTVGIGLSAGVYRYRIDLCHKNAQGEEIRSWSIISEPLTTVQYDTVSMVIPTVPFTRREDAYFLIFRTEANSTVFKLANSRDPSSASFVRNDQSVATMSYLDQLADATLASAEYHPANASGTYVDPLPAPACEVIAGGRDRLWLAGGELNFGEVAPSRLFFPGQTPSWNPSINIQVDRGFEPITAFGFLGDLTAIFRRGKTYILDSDGPDNSYNGTWPSPRLAHADIGAIGQESVILSVGGLWFQSPSGIRILGPGGAIVTQNADLVDPLAIRMPISAVVTVPEYSQIRWYSRDSSPALVYNYDAQTWASWTGLTSVGAVSWPVSGYAVVARGDGTLLVETPGVWTDDSTPYEMRVKTSWLHAKGLGDFQRVRRFALFGHSAPVTMRTRVFFDERDFWDEEFLDVYPGVDDAEVVNSSGWGENTWGAGTWGDVTSTTFRDGLFRWRHRLGRQKCSLVSFEFSDQGAATAGFVPTVLALELGVKPGLDRIPTQ